MYFATNDYQGVLRNINGAVRVIGTQELIDVYGPDHFPLPLEGTDFELVVDQVRLLAQTLPETTPLVVP